MPREPAKDGWVVLRDPEDKGPNLSFQGRDRRPRSRSWLHLDLYTADQQAEVERLIALGARRYPWRYRAGDDLQGAPERVKASLAASVPFPKRLGQPVEYAALAELMITNGYFNGESVRLDGAIRIAPR